jgi:hypothetical protein
MISLSFPIEIASIFFVILIYFQAHKMSFLNMINNNNFYIMNAAKIDVKFFLLFSNEEDFFCFSLMFNYNNEKITVISDSENFDI